MRPALAYLLAPVAGLAVFAAGWFLPMLPSALRDFGILAELATMAVGILVPAFVLVLGLSLGVMFWVRARFAGSWPAAAGGGVVLYLAAFALLALRVGPATVFANPYWVGGLLAGGLAHGLVFRALVGAGRPARGR
ncbi:MAG TPA: hypothetical protein VKA55_03910 [Gammaproteobacteria bacterium]|nr:hypothetical protein [Gammaproteobacteria bacterium]